MISVIVPIFNSEKYLSKCLESISSQKIRELEVICIDDGSTDGSASIVKDFQKKDSRFYLVKQKNQGRGSARNTGIKLAKGEYICFVDSDDKLEPNALELLLKKIREKGDAVVSSISVINFIYPEKSISDTEYYKIRFSGVKKTSPQLIFGFHYSPCGILFKRSIIEEFNISFPEETLYEDAYWHWCYFIHTKEVNFVKDSTYLYIRRSGSAMSQTFDKKPGLAIQHLTICDLIFKKLYLSNYFGNDIALKLLEQAFWFSFRNSPSSDKILVCSRTVQILRNYHLDPLNSNILTQLNNGNLKEINWFSEREEIIDEIVQFIRLKNLIIKKFPFIKKVTNSVYVILRRFYDYFK